MGIPPTALCYSPQISYYLLSNPPKAQPSHSHYRKEIKGQPPPWKHIYTTYIFFAWQINQTHTTSLLRLESNKAVCLKAESMSPLPLVWRLHQSSLRHHDSKHLWSPLGKSKFQGCFTSQEENCYPLIQVLNARGTEVPSETEKASHQEGVEWRA